MKDELKSGIPEADKLIKDFENGKINFLGLTDGLWNKGHLAGYEEGINQALEEIRKNFTPNKL